MADPRKDLITAAKKGDLARLSALLGNDRTLLDARDTDGSTALHCAAWKGHGAIVGALLEAGSDVQATNLNEHWGTTALHAAAHANQAAIAQQLIDAGADVNARDLEGRTPLDHTKFHKATAAAKVLGAHGGTYAAPVAPGISGEKAADT